MPPCRGGHKKRKKTYARTAIVRGNREQMYGYFPAFGKLSESEGGSTHSDDTKEAGGKV